MKSQQQAASSSQQQQVNHSQNQAQKSSPHQLCLPGPSTRHLKSSLSKLHNLVASQLSPASPRTGKLLAHHSAHPRQTSTQAQQATSTMKQANTSFVAGAGRGSHSTVSEKIAPELAKCYDEIDQIYDYIRGLAPLPVQLRKIKSIDFEQLERDRRIVELQHQHQALQQKQKQQQSQHRKQSARQAMRESSGDETLLLSASVPQPLRLTTCVAEGPPVPPVSSVKRVESLNLGSHHQRPSSGSALKLQQQRCPPSQQALLVTPLQRAPVSLFRLPRAHSTSTLNKPQQQHQHQQHQLDGRLLATSGRPHPQRPAGEQAANTRTLPALSISSSAARDPVARSSSLKRSVIRQQQQQQQQQQHQLCCEQQQQKQHSTGKPADFVESFVDDDDVSSVSGSRLASSRSSSSGGSPHHAIPSLASAERLKSHSDYDNDTASLSGSDTTSNSFANPGSQQQHQQHHPKACSSSARRRTSSGGGTLTSSANHRLTGSHSSSSGRPSSSSTAPSENKSQQPPRRPITEHIYEQIPAHKLMLSPHSGTGGRIKQYPVMYAPNMGLSTTTTTTAIARNNTAARLASCAISKRLHSSSHPLPLRPNQQARQRPAPPNQATSATPTSAAQLSQADQQPLPRLSMNNLHLIPFLAFGGATATTGHRASNTEPPAAARGGARGAPTQPGVFRLTSRAPPLSPAQLIGQCQMPRAVSKGRLQRPSEGGSPEPDSHSTAVSGGWNKTSTEVDVGRQESPVKEQARQAGFKWLKRDPSRRLTAIGIEQALECMKTAQNGLRDSSMLLNRDQSGKGGVGKQLVSTTGDKLVPLTTGSEQRKHPSAGELQRKQQPTSRFLNSISDLHSFSSCSSSSQQSEDTGSLPDQSEEGCCNSSGGSRIHSPAIRQPAGSSHRQPSSRETSDEWSSGGNFVSSRSFIKCYYGNEEKENLGGGADEVEEEEDEEEESFLAPVEPQQRAATNCSRRDLSSSTRPLVLRSTCAKVSPARLNYEPSPAPQKAPLQRKRNGSDRLLGLIGLQTSSARRLAHTKASNRVAANSASVSGAPPESQQPGARLSEPRGSIPGTGNSRQTLSASFFQQRPSLVASSGVGPTNFRQASSALVGNFLNSEGPILVRDKRLAGVELNMVQYYQHPCVQVRKMPTASQPHQQRATSRQRLASSTTNSTSTSTNSTSSYEAAIKNSNHSRPQHHDSPQSSSFSSSSKHKQQKQQQHLLSRPLPNPPALSLSNSSNGGGGGGSRSRASSRATPVSTNLDLAGLASPSSKPSPTVTTCTSSGISSRLTAGFTASGGQQQQRVKSLSELHKQSKRRQLTSQREQQQPSQGTATRRIEAHKQPQAARKEPDSDLSSSLKLFDENFSSKFADKQLASSSDSLLESINFSGTLNRKPANAVAVAVAASAGGSAS